MFSLYSQNWTGNTREPAGRYSEDVRAFFIFFTCIHSYSVSWLYIISFLMRQSWIPVVKLKVKATQDNTIQYSLKWYILTAVKKYNLAALSIFRTPGSFSYMEGAGRHARPSVDGRPPVRCLCCLSKRSESRQPWLQASVTAGEECVPIAHFQTKRPQPVHCIDPLQMATTFNT